MGRIGVSNFVKSQAVSRMGNGSISLGENGEHHPMENRESLVLYPIAGGPIIQFNKDS